MSIPFIKIRIPSFGLFGFMLLLFLLLHPFKGFTQATDSLSVKEFRKLPYKTICRLYATDSIALKIIKQYKSTRNVGYLITAITPVVTIGPGVIVYLPTGLGIGLALSLTHNKAYLYKDLKSFKYIKDHRSEILTAPDTGTAKMQGERLALIKKYQRYDTSFTAHFPSKQYPHTDSTFHITKEEFQRLSFQTITKRFGKDESCTNAIQKCKGGRVAAGLLTPITLGFGLLGGFFIAHGNLVKNDPGWGAIILVAGTGYCAASIGSALLQVKMIKRGSKSNLYDQLKNNYAHEN